MAPENDLQKVIYLPRFTVFEKHIRQRMQTIEQSTNQPTNQPTDIYVNNLHLNMADH